LEDYELAKMHMKNQQQILANRWCNRSTQIIIYYY